MSAYKSFSTRNWFEKGGSMEVYDIAAVKEDLLNHIFTEVGSRLMMPDFGTRIPTLTFEQLDEETLEIVRNDLNTVFDYDPRVKVLDLSLYSNSDEHSILAEATLFFVEFGVSDIMNIDFG